MTEWRYRSGFRRAAYWFFAVGQGPDRRRVDAALADDLPAAERRGRSREHDLGPLAVGLGHRRGRLT